ncbi:hypothetical protein GFY24_39020 [Nocardia sp. SYP-A9097]|uniref:hypothetical protein n=1 Tax=Nocardia sp. SYP-A9097 TaxID=2663237 RepID=UPI00129BFFFD|nr:hypothetical protein [Nocardia sp. SYP-A9097]MRH93343.1 hypothetical protein [Nocardia sp. SYP-A9097]
MTTTSAPVSSAHTHRRRIPKWDKVVTGVCLALVVMVAIWLMSLTAILAMGADPCEPESPCMELVGHGMQVSLLGTVAVLVIGLGCVIIAAITRRTWMFIWALATLLLLPVPLAVGSDIVKHASELSTVTPSHP